MSEITKEQLAVLTNVRIWADGYRTLTSKDIKLIELVYAMIESEKPKECRPPKEFEREEWHIVRQSSCKSVYGYNFRMDQWLCGEKIYSPRKMYELGCRYHKPVDLT